MRCRPGWSMRSLDFPYLLLLASGGHCQLLEVRGSAIIGGWQRPSTMPPARRSTRRRSCSTSAIPADRRSRALAKDGDPQAVPLPRPLVGTKEPHFSFAGLKAAVQRAVACGEYRPKTSPPASSRRWSTASSTAPGAPGRVRRAEPGGRRRGRRQCLGPRRAQALAARPWPALLGSAGWLCTDNAAMIGWAGAERFAAGLVDGLDAPARARWPLDPEGEKVRGAGVKA